VADREVAPPEGYNYREALTEEGKVIFDRAFALGFEAAKDEMEQAIQDEYDSWWAGIQDVFNRVAEVQP
jgi:hypothetical protein